MSFKVVAWTLLGALALAAVLLFNYWAAYQPSKYAGLFGNRAGALSGWRTWRFPSDFWESANDPPER